MWAHYADAHHGVVIEFDARTAGFLDEETNMVPAHFGSVIYTSQPDVTSYASIFKEGIVVGGPIISCQATMKNGSGYFSLSHLIGRTRKRFGS